MGVKAKVCRAVLWGKAGKAKFLGAGGGGFCTPRCQAHFCCCVRSQCHAVSDAVVGDSSGLWEKAPLSSSCPAHIPQYSGAAGSPGVLKQPGMKPWGDPTDKDGGENAPPTSAELLFAIRKEEMLGA